MMLCILGPNEKKEFHLKLIEKAKERFDKVLYAPLSGIRVEMEGEKYIPYYKSANISEFDVVLPLVSKSNVNFGAAIAKILEDKKVYTPISSEAILYAYNPFLTFLIHEKLKNLKVSFPKMYLSVSRDALNAIIPKLKYPVVMKAPTHKTRIIKFESEEALKSYIDTIELLSQPLMIEEVNGEEIEEIQVLVLGDKVYAVKDEEYLRVGQRIRSFIISVAEMLDTDILQATLTYGSNNHIFLQQLSVNMKLGVFEKALEKDLTKEMVNLMKNNAQKFYERKSLINMVDKALDSMLNLFHIKKV